MKLNYCKVIININYGFKFAELIRDKTNEYVKISLFSQFYVK